MGNSGVLEWFVVISILVFNAVWVITNIIMIKKIKRLKNQNNINQINYLREDIIKLRDSTHESFGIVDNNFRKAHTRLQRLEELLKNKTNSSNNVTSSVSSDGGYKKFDLSNLLNNENTNNTIPTRFKHLANIFNRDKEFDKNVIETFGKKSNDTYDGFMDYGMYYKIFKFVNSVVEYLNLPDKENVVEVVEELVFTYGEYKGEELISFIINNFDNKDIMFNCYMEVREVIMSKISDGLKKH